MQSAELYHTSFKLRQRGTRAFFLPAMFRRSKLLMYCKFDGCLGEWIPYTKVDQVPGRVFL